MSKWKIVELGDLTTELSMRNRLNKDIPVYSVTNSVGFTLSTDYFSKEVFSKDTSNYKIVPRGTFAYNPSRINVGSIAWQDCLDEVIVSPLYVVFSISERLDQQFLWYFLRGNIGLAYINSLTTGSVRDSLKYSALQKISIPLPPLDEQRRIAATLDAVSEILKLRKAHLAELDNLVKSQFIEMFGDPVTNPMGWDTYTVEDVCRVIVDCPHSTPSYTPDNTGFACIRTSIMKPNRLLWDDIEYIPKDEYVERIKRHRPTAGDIVYSREGAILGVAAIIDRDIPVALGQRQMLLEANNQICSSAYLCYVLNSNGILRQVKDKIGGSASPHINVADIKQFSVSVPPIMLQNQFAAFVQQVDKSKFEIQKSLEALETLKNALMQQYFE